MTKYPFHHELHTIKLKEIIENSEVLIRDQNRKITIKHRSESSEETVTTMMENEKEGEGDRRDLATNNGDGRKGIP